MTTLCTGMAAPFPRRGAFNEDFKGSTLYVKRGQGSGMALIGAAAILFQFFGPFDSGFAHPAQPPQNQHGADAAAGDAGENLPDAYPQGLAVGGVLSDQGGFLQGQRRGLKFGRGDVLSSSVLIIVGQISEI